MPKNINEIITEGIFSLETSPKNNLKKKNQEHRIQKHLGTQQTSGKTRINGRINI